MNEVAVVGVALAAVLLDAGHDRADGVDQREQGAGYVRVETKFAVPELTEEVLAFVGDGFELREPEKSARSLDGMNAAEDVGEASAVVRIFFQLDKVVLELVQALEAFD